MVAVYVPGAIPVVLPRFTVAVVVANPVLPLVIDGMLEGEGNVSQLLPLGVIEAIDMFVMVSVDFGAPLFVIVIWPLVLEELKAGDPETVIPAIGYHIISKLAVRAVTGIGEIV